LSFQHRPIKKEVWAPLKPKSACGHEAQLDKFRSVYT